MLEKRIVLTARIPATPCTPEMLGRVLEVASEYGVSRAEVVRTALEFFFGEIDNKAISLASKTDEERIAPKVAPYAPSEGATLADSEG